MERGATGGEGEERRKRCQWWTGLCTRGTNQPTDIRSYIRGNIAMERVIGEGGRREDRGRTVYDTVRLEYSNVPLVVSSSSPLSLPQLRFPFARPRPVSLTPTICIATLTFPPRGDYVNPVRPNVTASI